MREVGGKKTTVETVVFNQFWRRSFLEFFTNTCDYGSPWKEAYARGEALLITTGELHCKSVLAWHKQPQEICV